ncbi:dihydroorotate dehydrogenase [Celeribacter indicus]|uniref:dihydrouracil dehydrogenase (NAD(+)) n=1 Tax=Celeribacter indicus TaxID=1208324 RepID=A0A0B5DTE9_9RHOB|nr:dihydroorotate dehydrogenase [Celeribacter indicus]AJE46703.1 dihydroorotate dehydrogenase [Celeribacter indicus]SDX04362.1 dihydroorotate dehydrogenase (NAD+) catalytic subunit [Celeribacter indicus]
MASTSTKIGSLTLKNPVIAAPGEHLIPEAGIRAAIEAGAGAVVGKSTNESDAAKDQLSRAEYVALDTRWRPVDWGPQAPEGAMLLSRSGLTPHPFEDWLEMSLRMRALAREHDCLYVPSLILAAEEPACALARRIAAAGFEVLEFNIGTPYASQAAKGAVSTVLDPERIGRLTRMMTATVDIPVWIKITGQSERVPDLAAAAFENGAESVVMAGRALGMLPDLETQAPVLSTSCGFGGFWNLPLTCHWLASSRALLGDGPALIGINGATDGEDVLRMVLAGASAVGMSSEVMLRGFDVLRDAVERVASYCAAHDTDLSELVGRAADRRKRFADMPQLDENWRRYIPGASNG